MSASGTISISDVPSHPSTRSEQAESRYDCTGENPGLKTFFWRLSRGLRGQLSNQVAKPLRLSGFAKLEIPGDAAPDFPRCGQAIPQAFPRPLEQDRNDSLLRQRWLGHRPQQVRIHPGLLQQHEHDFLIYHFCLPLPRLSIGSPRQLLAAEQCAAPPVPARAPSGPRIGTAVPSPGVDSTSIVPPINSTSRFEIARPRPVPPKLRLIEASARLNDENRRGSWSGALKRLRRRLADTLDCKGNGASQLRVWVFLAF